MMFVVMRSDFDPELNSVWGPFATRKLAAEWIEKQPDKDELDTHKLIYPYLYSEEETP